VRGIIAVSVLLGFAITVALVSWLTLIYIDMNHDWVRRNSEFPKRATRWGLGQLVYHAMWRRRERWHERVQARERDAAIKWGRDQR
jgi:hypothetical protein